MLEFKVDKDFQKLTVGRYLRTYCSVSARTLAKLKKIQGAILLNGKPVRAVDLVKMDDIICIDVPKSTSDGVAPVNLPLDVVYEDDFLVVLNKPPFMPVHPTKVHQQDTLANALAFYAESKGESFTFHAVNRLDRNTSGLVLVAKDRHTASVLSQTEITKHYTAFAHGKIAEKGTVNGPIALSDDSKIVRKVSEWGKPSITHFEPVDDYEDFTVLKLVLETGRTHQIRCHMSYIGHPLLGDDLYGGNLDKINRHALHCGYISFFHPIKNDIMEFKADLPDDMKSLLN
ncbi:MAG: RluA family pseudouridine synthase [Clostridia bacterium]|nr:RluA family pseudouridine synthase [Clostridia bacterium]